MCDPQVRFCERPEESNPSGLLDSGNGMITEVGGRCRNSASLGPAYLLNAGRFCVMQGAGLFKQQATERTEFAVALLPLRPPVQR
jgi:hypothetical protein